MVDNLESKQWWESEMDWTLPNSLQGTLEAGQRLLRNIPATLGAYRLGKSTPLDRLNPDPVEKLTAEKTKGCDNSSPAQAPASNGSAPRKPLPRIIEPPPKPPALLRRTQPSSQSSPRINQQGQSTSAPQGPRAVDMTAMAANSALVNDEQNSPVSNSPVNEEPAIKEKIAQIVEERKITLEQMLDPDFCGYSS